MKPSKREIAQIEFLTKRGFRVTPKTKLIPRGVPVTGGRFRMVTQRVYAVEWPSFRNLPHVAD